jgi:hypothetical protein
MTLADLTHSRWTRRQWLQLAGAGVVGWSVSGWFERLAAATASDPQRRRACILLWMNGGPSQLDTWDPKPDHANGGPYRPIATRVPGIQISEHLPKLAQEAQHLAIIRSMHTREADHGRATYLLRTGVLPGGPIQYPPLGAMVAKELEQPEDELPGFVSIAPMRQLSPAAYHPGFLGPRYAPLIVGDGLGSAPGASYEDRLKVDNLEADPSVTAAQGLARWQLWEEMEGAFLRQRPGAATLSHRTAYDRAARMMRSAAAGAFDLGQEASALRDAYGRNLFGQGCLLARRLVERGVPFVEVTLGGPGDGNPAGWDTHADNFESVRRLSSILDPAFATLVRDLQDRGLWQTTLVIWMGEFGRTPRINGQQGRDHFANAWSVVLAGGGIRGGQVVGQTSADGMEIADRPVSVADLFATIYLALGIDYNKKHLSNIGRPVKIVDKNPQPIREILA